MVRQSPSLSVEIILWWLAGDNTSRHKVSFWTCTYQTTTKTALTRLKSKWKEDDDGPPFIPTPRPYFISVFCHSWFSRTKPSHMMMMLHNSLPRHPYQPPNLTTPGRIINSFFFSSVYVEKSDKFSFFLISMYYPSKRYEFNTEIVILKVDLCIILLKEKRWQINFFFH